MFLRDAFARALSLAARVAASLVFLAAYCGAALADALAGPWVRGFSNEVRLLAGRADAGSGERRFAGVEIAMPAGWKTYWRTPGESGVPPEFDWSASKNLASARVLYPAPRRFTDKSGAIIGYQERALFPIEIAASDPSKPILLRVKASYGVCKDLCVPAETELSLEVPPTVGKSEEITTALALVPRTALRPELDPALAGWGLETAGKPRLLLDVSDPSKTTGDAFVESSDKSYLPLPKIAESKDGLTRFELDLSDGVDVKALSGKSLTVTLVGATGQSETTITVK